MSEFSRLIDTCPGISIVIPSSLRIYGCHRGNLQLRLCECNISVDMNSPFSNESSFPTMATMLGTTEGGNLNSHHPALVGRMISKDSSLERLFACYGIYKFSSIWPIDRHGDQLKWFHFCFQFFFSCFVRQHVKYFHHSNQAIQHRFICAAGMNRNRKEKNFRSNPKLVMECVLHSLPRGQNSLSIRQRMPVLFLPCKVEHFHGPAPLVPAHTNQIIS